MSRNDLKATRQFSSSDRMFEEFFHHPYAPFFTGPLVLISVLGLGYALISAIYEEPEKIKEVFEYLFLIQRYIFDYFF